MTWTARVRDVRRHAGGLRWTLLASTADLETVVYVDTTERGSVLDIQSDGYVGWSGDEQLDELVCEQIADCLTKRGIHRTLDRIEGRRPTRSDRVRLHPRRRDWWCAR
jgi:hypothetical protein